MLLQHLDLTTALRPVLSPDETLLFVQDGVGLYHGKQKLADFQNGHVYLTSHRFCYVDDPEPRKNSVTVALKEVDHCEFYAGFFKSSPKVVLFTKPGKYGQLDQSSVNPNSTNLRPSTTQGPLRSPSGEDKSSAGSWSPRASSSTVNNVTWICPICSFSNQLPVGFDLSTAGSEASTPPCQTCGIKPDVAYILKVAIAGASGRLSSNQKSVHEEETSTQHLRETYSNSLRSFEDDHPSKVATGMQECSRCTYLNHPSITSCEMCGALLPQPIENGQFRGNKARHFDEVNGDRQSVFSEFQVESLRVSFRTGGDKSFFERLKGALVQRKWLLLSAPPIPEPATGTQLSAADLGRNEIDRKSHNAASSKSVGIAGLENRGFAVTKKNEAMLGTAFADLDALMASAKEVIALAESFARDSSGGNAPEAGQLIAESASGLDMITTKDMLGHGSGSESLYLAELSRHLAEYLTDNNKGVLKNEGGIMTLVDLWAVFNRSRGGIELISPSDFEKAASLWEQLRLPVRMRQFKNGLLLVQHSDRTDDKTIAQLLDWMQNLRATSNSSAASTGYDPTIFGIGVTSQEVAHHFGWSVGVASEELAMAEEHGALCRDDGVEGIKYWENWLIDYEDFGDGDDLVTDGTKLKKQQEEDLLQGLKDTGLL